MSFRLLLTLFISLCFFVVSAQQWQPLGPYKVPENDGGGLAVGIGRTTCVRFHPNYNEVDNNQVFAGSVASGAWIKRETTSDWENINTSNLPVLSIADIAINPKQIATIYLATGDQDSQFNYDVCAGNFFEQSRGVFKSINGGKSWTTEAIGQWDNDPNFWDYPSDMQMGDLIIHPQDTNILLITLIKRIKQDSIRGMVFRSEDSGKNWKKVLQTEKDKLRDLKFHPFKPDIVYVAGQSIWKSTDAGKVWKQLDIKLDEKPARIKIAVTPSAPDNLYFLAASTCFKGTYTLGISHTQGEKFRKKNNWSINARMDRPCWRFGFDVSPVDSNYMAYGSLDILHSKDGGITFTKLSNWASSYQKNKPSKHVHADLHYLAFSPTGSLFASTDGGIYKKAKENTYWEDISDGLNTAKIKGLGISQYDNSVVYAGTQDVGGILYDSSYENKWGTVTGGDGGRSEIDPAYDSILYHIDGFNKIMMRSDDRGKIWTRNFNPRPKSGIKTAFLMIVDPIHPTTIYAGFKEVWKSENRGNTWVKISDFENEYHVEDKNLITMAVAPNNSKVIYAGYSHPTWGKSTDHKMFKTVNGGKSWEAVGTNLKAFQWRSLMSLAVHPDDETNIVSAFKTCNGNIVFQSVDGGITWRSISFNLPKEVSGEVVKFHPWDNSIFLGTTKGVFQKKENENSWKKYGDDLPNVKISDLEISDCLGNITVGTRGYGVWRAPFDVKERKRYPKLNTVTIDEDTVIEGKQALYTNWKIKEGTSLTIMGTLKITDGAAIEVEDNANIALQNGSKILGICQEGWKGNMIIHPNGKLQLAEKSVMALATKSTITLKRKKKKLGELERNATNLQLTTEKQIIKEKRRFLFWWY